MEMLREAGHIVHFWAYFKSWRISLASPIHHFTSTYIAPRLHLHHRSSKHGIFTYNDQSASSSGRPDRQGCQYSLRLTGLCTISVGIVMFFGLSSSHLYPPSWMHFTPSSLHIYDHTKKQQRHAPYCTTSLYHLFSLHTYALTFPYRCL